MRSGAQALVEALERAGAEVVFGYPGAMPSIMAFEKTPFSS